MFQSTIIRSIDSVKYSCTLCHKISTAVDPYLLYNITHLCIAKTKDDYNE